MRVVSNISSEPTAWVLARLNESYHFVFARIVESFQKFKAADAPIGT